jgi:hypothetical protein
MDEGNDRDGDHQTALFPSKTFEYLICTSLLLFDRCDLGMPESG